MVKRAEGLPQAEKDTCDIIFNRLAESKAYDEAGQACRAEHGADEKSRLDDFQCHDQSDDHNGRPHRLRSELPDEAVRSDPSVNPVAGGGPSSRQPEQQEYDQR
jgi:hypothetical protein